MSHLWWTRNHLVIAAAVVSMGCVCALVGVGLPPEPATSAALGPEWQCSRLALVFTTCSRVEHGEAGRLAVGQAAHRRATAGVIGSR